MSMIEISLQHNSTLDEAQKNLEGAVADVQQRFGQFVKQTEWAADRRAVVLKGPGVIVDLRLDATHLHAKGDIPLLGKLLSNGVGKRLSEGLRGTIQKHFPRGIPDQRK